ncbi:6,7-dimethyl-8-ribityllumazine synthase [Sinimarinibacterium sp. CAU 1509]|uniref:6,7-dimethyl-8-ribityllumazine synthase n=1 Tax=Sinimarinibacterium sp. CAU 1509 TaxID=2562283 RepID=UPI0010ACE2D1|nr:6,7-dimethyl-8-ribityllumazine synthase [Sinimarinibacterium sp. CAU 1509]TJY60872.1 6,7-dimethyl-8-ribityllumazine synthase [Sinimarinibacterium sp. CAU 1509]
MKKKSTAAAVPSDAKTGYAAPEAAAPGEFANLRVALLMTRWNVGIVDALSAGARKCLREWGVKRSGIVEFRAPGAYEVPLAAQMLLGDGGFDAVIALGAVIRGDTPHFDYVAGECASGIMRVQLDMNKPVGFGVLTVNTVQQAWDRAGKGRDNKGYEATAAVLEMIRLSRSLGSL